MHEEDEIFCLAVLELIYILQCNMLPLLHHSTSEWQGIHTFSWLTKQ